jgi:hypothetical protein
VAPGRPDLRAYRRIVVNNWRLTRVAIDCSDDAPIGANFLQPRLQILHRVSLNADVALCA